MKGFPKWLIKLNFSLAVPIIKLGKSLAAVPYLRHIPNLFFSTRFNQVTAIPIRQLEINENVEQTSSPLPIKIVEMLVEKASNIMILDECICRSYYKKDNKNIGCMVLGRAALDIHPSAGRIVDIDEAKAHLKRAADASLVANIAHVWIDPMGFGVTSFSKMLFICFCGEDSCLYTDGLKVRCPNLDKAYKRLEGLSVYVDTAVCSGCGACAEKCFVSAITIHGEKAHIEDFCKGCGRCIACCPENAISLSISDKEMVFEGLLKRVSELADIG
jgi:Pyruvate/2-oxoacid:ferredoxin oxidoreductase delta subunit